MSFKSKSDISRKSKILSSASALGLSPVSHKEKLGLVSLEPRILLDAAGFITGTEVAMDSMVFNDAQLGVQGIFEGQDLVTREALDFETQRLALLESLSSIDFDSLETGNLEADEERIPSDPVEPPARPVSLTDPSYYGGLMPDIGPVRFEIDQSGVFSELIESAGPISARDSADTENVTSAPITEPVSMTGPPIVDLNGPDDAGIDFETRIQPTTGNIFPIVDFDATVMSSTGVLTSVTIDFAGILDGASELAYHNGPAGATAFFFNTGTQTATVAIDAGGTVLLDVTRVGTNFTITGPGGTATADVNIQTFLSQFLYGDLAVTASEGPRTMSITLSDTSGVSQTAVSTINVHYFPSAGNDVNATLANNTSPVSGNVLANDTDPTAGDVLQVSEVDSYAASLGQPYVSTYGTLTLNADGTYDYQVDVTNATVLGLRAGASVTDIIAYTVIDLDGNTDTAYLTVTINGVDEVPVATDNTNVVTRTDNPIATGSVIFDDDGFGVDSGDRPFSQLIWENEFANGEFVGGQSVTIDGVTATLTSSDPASNAGASNHVVSYGENGGHVGYLVFTAENGDASNTAHEMNIAFSEAVTNLSFTLADLDWSQATAWQDQFTIIGLLDGEVVDLSAQVSGTVVQVGDNTFYGTGSVPNTEAHGNVNILFNTPVDEVRILYNYGPDATVRDGFQIGALSDLNWQNTGVPRVGAVDGVIGNVGVQVAGQYGFFTINGDGTYTYEIDPTNPAVIALTGSDTLIDSIPYTLIDTVDNSGNTDIANLTITINAPNTAPIAENDAVGGTENAVVTFDAFLNNGVDLDRDVDGDTFTITRVASGGDETVLTGLADGSGLTGTVAGSMGGTFLVLADGTMTFDPGTDFDDLAAGETRTTQIVYQIDDGNGGTDTAIVTYTVTGENDNIIPVIPGDPNPPPDRTNFIPPQVGVDSSVITDLDLSTFFSDPDITDVITFTLDINDLPPGLTFDGTTISGTPDPDASQGGVNGVYMFDVTVTDSNGDTFTTSVTYTITNPAPIAENDAITGTESDSAASFNIFVDNGVDIDSDPDGDIILVTRVATGNDESVLAGITDGTGVGSAVAGSNGGLFTINPDGTASFDANGEFEDLAVGETRVTEIVYQIDDGEGGTDTAIVTYTVTGENDLIIPVIPGDPNPPADRTDFIPPQTGVDSSVITDLDLSTFFSDPDITDVITFTLDVNDLPPGLTFDGTTISGTPDANASQGGVGGVYTFDVTVTDSNGDTFVTTVTYTITNPAPTAQDNVATATEDGAAATGNVITDNDPDDGLDTDPDGDTLFVSEVDGIAVSAGNPAIIVGLYGTLTLNEDGSYSYLQDDTNPAVNSLAVGETLTESFTYTLTDREGGTDTADLVVTIEGANDNIVPVIPGDPNSPADRTDFIPPQIGVDSAVGTPLDLSTFFSDPDTSDTITFTLDPADLPPGLSFDGTTISGTPDADASQGGVGGVYSIDVTVTDSNGDTFVTTVTYTITNPVPVAEDDALTISEDTPSISGSVYDDNGNGHDTDPDGDTLTVSEVDGDANNVGQAVAGSNGGLFTINPDGTYTFETNGEFEGLDVGETATTTITYQISDGEGGFDEATVTVTVTGENDAPVLTGPIPDQIGDDSAPLTPFDVSAYFTDPDVELMLFDLEGEPSWMEINPLTGEITGTPPADASQGGPNGDGVYPITIVAVDQDGAETRVVINYTISNPAPTATDDNFIANEDGPVITGNLISVDNGNGMDSDLDGDVLFVEEVNGDANLVGAQIAGSTGGLFTVNADGSYSFDANGDFEDLDVGETRITTITYLVSDGEGGTDLATVTVTVQGSNDAPVLVPGGDIPAQDGEDSDTLTPLDVSGAFDDVDGEDLTFTSPDMPSWMMIDPDSGVITGTPPADASQGGPNGDGVYIVTIVATDPDGETVETTVTYTITNPPPVAMDDVEVTDEDTVLSDSVLPDNGNGADADPDGDVLSVTQVNGVDIIPGAVINLPSGALLTMNADGSYDYDPNGQFEGLDVGEMAMDSFTYQISDGEGGFSEATVNITIEGVNDAPIVVTPLTVQTGDDSAPLVPLDVSGSFNDVDGEDLTFSSPDIPTWMVIDPVTGIITGTPPADASQGGPNGDGMYTITVVATDPDGATVETTVTYTIANPVPVVDTPVGPQVAVDAEDVSIPTMFSDPDGDDLTYTALGLPEGLMIDPNTGEITGTIDNSASQGGPNGDGVYIITVTADDGEGGTVTDTFTLTVTNPAPDAVDDTNTASEDGTVSGNVITDPGTDTDPDGDDLTVSEVDGNAANVGQPVAGTNGGLFTINPDGTYLFNSNGDFEGLDVGETATTTITYQISDGEGGFDTATVTIAVTGENDAPIIVDPNDPGNPPADPNAVIPAQTGDDSAPLTELDVTPFFDDVDGETLTFTSPDLPSWMIIDPVTGVITGTPPADASQGGLNGDGVYVITVVATDPDGEQVTTQVTYTISNPPPVAENDSYTTAEDTPITVNILTDNDSDPDGDDIVVDMAALPDGTIIPMGVATEIPEGTLTVNADGTVTFEPRLNFFGPVTFGYTISDGQGGTDVATVTINVTPVNDTPIPVDPTQPPLDPNDPDTPTDPQDPENYIPIQEGVDGDPVTELDLTPYFGDPDPMEPLTITLDPSELPSGLTFDPETGIISGTPDADASQGGDPNNPGTYVIAVTVTDPSGESFTTNVTYVITNPAPVATDDGVLDVPEDTPTQLDLMGNDNDPDGDDLVITEINGTSITVGVPVTLPSGAIVTLNPDGTVIYEPVEDYNGPDSFTYTISDGEGGTDTATVTLEITPVNDTPNLIPGVELPPRDNVDGQTIDPVDVSGPFEDIDGDPLTYTADGLPDGLTIDPETGIITGTLPPGTSADGPFTVTITATDPDGASITTEFVWTVENLPPVVMVPLPPVTANDGDALTIPTAPNFDDPDKDDVTFIADGLPEGLTIDPETGVISGMIDGSASVDGPYEVTVTVTDSQGESTSSTFTLDVLNPAPVIAEVIVPPSPAVGEPVVINVAEAVNDPDGDGVLTYTSNDLPPGLTLDPDTGIITGSPTVPQEAPYVFTVLVDDGEGGVTPVELTLQVNEDGYVAPAEVSADRLITEVDPYEFLEGKRIDLKRYFYDRALENRDDMGRMFGDRDFRGGMVISQIAGFNNDVAYLVIEAVAYDHHINVQLASPLEMSGDTNVKSWDVNMANGTSLPSWIDWHEGADFIAIQRPIDVENIRLKVRALLDNGRTATTTVEVDLRSGSVVEVGKAFSQTQTLGDQLKLETQRLAEGSHDLLQALAS